jgi:hypothetical protein
LRSGTLETVHHNDAIALFRTCTCPCHTSTATVGDSVAVCWCDGTTPDPYQISHNDRVRYLRRCDCRAGTCGRQHTDPHIANLFEKKAADEQQHRIRTGRPTSADLAHIAKNPHRYPHLYSSRKPKR